MSARHMIYLVLLVIVLSGTATFGLRETAFREETYTETPTPAQAETTVDFVKLTMNLDKTIYKIGEPVNMTLILTNIGNKTIFLSRSSPPVLDFVVYNESDQIIYAYSWGGFIAVVVSYPIEPGESFIRTFTWHQQEKIAYNPQTIYRQIDPGFYFVAGRIALGAGVYDGEVVVSDVETPRLLIDVIPKESIVVESTRNPLKLVMILNKTTYRLGETIKITFSIENIGNKTLDMSQYEDGFNFVVYDEAGSEVYDYNKNWLHPAIYIPMPLPPDLSRFGVLTWSQDYNLKLITLDPHPLFEYRKVLPGRYQIVGQFISSHSRLIIKTPPVTITIDPYETESTEAMCR